METGLTVAGAAALAGVMVLGALVPGISVLTVSARSASLGFSHGVLATAGIVTGDMVFILVAIYGLSALSGLLGDHVVLIRYFAALCLVWLGVALWRSKPLAGRVAGNSGYPVQSSFLAGLLVTLADQKAILFYLGIFPAFMDLSALSVLDTGIILAIAVVAVGAPKLFYAMLAGKAAQLVTGPQAGSAISTLAGSVLIGIGVFLVVYS